MKHLILVCLAVLLSACASPDFVGDAPPVAVSTRTPSHFELPARFAIARMVYNQAQPAGAKEVELWDALTEQAEELGSFSPLVTGKNDWIRDPDTLIEAARAQRYRYLLLVRMHPSTGSADILVYHVGSGGVMATAQAVSPSGGREGFWGGAIGSRRRLERETLKIAKVAIPEVEKILHGIAQRQR